MKKIIIDIPVETYERALKLTDKLNISFDEPCQRGIRKPAEAHLDQDNENENHQNKL